MASPENRPTPLSALLAEETPIPLHYRRNHFDYPTLDVAGWSLRIDGAVARPLQYSAEELRRLPAQSLRVLLECAGHRRTEYQPPISGVQWKTGALGQARWGGISLASVLEPAGISDDAIEVVLYGADAGAFQGLEGEYPFARSLPLEKALDPDTLLAWEMNGEPLPREHGAPLRAIVPGWYAMDSVKWLTRIEVVTEPFRGPFQELDYRFQAEGETGIGERLAAMPISSLILTPEDSQTVPAGRSLARGIAWGGERGVAAVELRVDGGPWFPAALEPAAGPYQRVLWSASYEAPSHPHTLSVRATDGAGNAQPEKAPWNRRGYANNGIHQIQLQAG